MEQKDAGGGKGRDSCWNWHQWQRENASFPPRLSSPVSPLQSRSCLISNPGSQAWGKKQLPWCREGREVRERLFIEEKVPMGIGEGFLRRSTWGLPRPRGPTTPTCVLAGEFGLGIAHPSGPLTAVLIATVLAVLVSVASPALRDAGPIRDAVEFLFAAFDHRWQHWNKKRAGVNSSQLYGFSSSTLVM